MNICSKEKTISVSITHDYLAHSTNYSLAAQTVYKTYIRRVHMNGYNWRARAGMMSQSVNIKTNVRDIRGHIAL